MFTVKPVAMPGNPAANNMGDRSGLWQIEIRNEETGTVEYDLEDLTYEQAFIEASKRQKKMNS
jgi:hypothetical protein